MSPIPAAIPSPSSATSPFGEQWYNTASDKFIFTSYERDSESGNDYAMARYYISPLGRFSSPDPIPGDTSDPQTLNRYAYVRNDTLSFVDPSGLNRQAPLCSPDVDCSAWYGGDGGGWEAELLELAFTPTSYADFYVQGYENGEPMSGILSLPIFGNIDLLDLLGAPDPGDHGGTPYTGGGSPYVLVLMVDCSDQSGRYRDYQAALPNNASGPVPPLTIAENLIGTDATPTTNWGNNVGDHLRPNAILPGGEDFQQSFYAKTSGGAWRPMAISINSQLFTSQAISERNSREQGISVLVNGQPAPTQMKTGNCPNNPGDQP